MLLTSAVCVAAWSLYKARRDYRVHGRVTRLGLLSLCAMLFVPNLMLHYAMAYRMPDSLLEVIGVFVAAAGLALCMVGVFAFRSVAKTLCLDVGKLTVTGPYRWSRNPQYVGWFVFLTGFALTSWSVWCLVALLLVAVSLHLLVLIEEEHLIRVFGEPYREFLAKTPRYVGWA